jgi:hypothetical protein
VLVVVILFVGSSFQSLMVKGKMCSSMHRLRSCNGRTCVDVKVTGHVKNDGSCMTMSTVDVLLLSLTL